MQPDVSVVIPTYNRRKFLEKAVQSCFSGSDALDVEVVVVDDGSTDGTRDYLRALDDERVRPVFQEHQGAQRARNRGLSEAQGQFIKFLDDDDWLAEGALSAEVETLSRSGAGLCYGSCKVHEESGNVRTFSQHDASFRPEDLISALLEESIIYRPFRYTYRSDLAKAHEWDENLSWRQDYQYILSIAATEPDHRPTGTVSGFVRQHDGERISRSVALPTKLHIQLDLLRRTVNELTSREAFSSQRRRVAVQKAWMLAHMMSAYDMSAFKDAFSLVSALDPGFKPERGSPILSLLDDVLGVQQTEYLLHPVRRMKHITSSLL
ncbi:glycosyltransferase family 2 protein [Salinibacter ruber]|uniref:Glycosyltransferase involved in cell wall biosynthesis n=1 Tax=Salinibacter ruber TaxID=146919 RepID=A0A9X2UBP6_9BACT|nr:glycosyltransferase family 2 protein [Salinibacter ruber]MCS3953202.1 glycosyltransferase involved in cell wall biosynthesis [Salinibacter ruber]MCS4116167.1 glycosyltransferase involved in cell wall biosynthesis [Salinibacter ruber]MCS4181678.1 glycosyltransferase involved in cell wall biosynthesis [Salinibacter ruber]